MSWCRAVPLPLTGQMDGRTNTGPSHNIYHASIVSRDKNLAYLSVVHLRSLKMVPLDRRCNFLFFVPVEVYSYVRQFPRYGMSKKIQWLECIAWRLRGKNLVCKCIVNNSRLSASCISRVGG